MIYPFFGHSYVSSNSDRSSWTTSFLFELYLSYSFYSKEKSILERFLATVSTQHAECTHIDDCTLSVLFEIELFRLPWLMKFILSVVKYKSHLGRIEARVWAAESNMYCFVNLELNSRLYLKRNRSIFNFATLLGIGLWHLFSSLPFQMTFNSIFFCTVLNPECQGYLNRDKPNGRRGWWSKQQEWLQQH